MESLQDVSHVLQQGTALRPGDEEELRPHVATNPGDEVVVEAVGEIAKTSHNSQVNLGLEVSPGLGGQGMTTRGRGHKVFLFTVSHLPEVRPQVQVGAEDSKWCWTIRIGVGRLKVGEEDLKWGWEIQSGVRRFKVGLEGWLEDSKWG